MQSGEQPGASPAPAQSESEPKPEPIMACARRVQIDVPYPGASPQEVEAGVLMAVEQALQGLANVEAIEAVALRDVGRVWVRFPEASLEAGLVAVKERVDHLKTLPADVDRPWVALENPRSARVVVLTRSSNVVPATSLIEDALRGVPGVGPIHGYGGVPQVLSIRADPDRLKAMGLTVSAVADAVRHSPVLDVDSEDLLAPRPIDIEALGRIEVTTSGGHRVPLDAIVTLELGARHHGPQVRVGESAAELTVIYAQEAGVVRDALADIAPVPGIEHRVLGHVQPRGCPSITGGPELFGDLEVRELESVGPWGTGPAVDLPPRDGSADDLVWLMGASLRSGTGAGPGRIEVIGPRGSPSFDVLDRFIARSSTLRSRGRYGGDWGHAVVRLRHPRPEGRIAMVGAVVEQARARALSASAGLEDEPQIDIVLRDAGTQRGLTTSQLARQVRQGIYGESLKELRYGRRSLTIRMEAVASDAASEESIASLTIHTPSGSVPLLEVAEVSLHQQPRGIGRRDGQRIDEVHLGFADAERGAVSAWIDDVLLPGVRAAHPDGVAERAR